MRVVNLLMKEKGLVPLMNSAYQGCASGDITTDAWTMRFFESVVLQILVLLTCELSAGSLRGALALKLWIHPRWAPRDEGARGERGSAQQVKGATQEHGGSNLPACVEVLWTRVLQALRITAPIRM